MSTAHFVIRPSAASNLEAIEEFLSEKASPDIAAAFLGSITDAFRLLAGQPEMGRHWASPLPRLHDLRAWPLHIHQGYLILGCEHHQEAERFEKLGEVVACQASLASSYFLAWSEGWRRFVSKSAMQRSNARSIEGGAVA